MPEVQGTQQEIKMWSLPSRLLSRKKKVIIQDKTVEARLTVTEVWEYRG